MARTTREMSDRHELFLAELFDARRMPGSGNGFANQMDARNDARRQFHPFAVDGKSTFGKGLTLTLDDIHKAEEQAHSEIPAFGLRWYADETLRHTEDWIVVPAGAFAGLLEDARAYREMVGDE